jgi:hypothetical protein
MRDARCVVVRFFAVRYTIIQLTNIKGKGNEPTWLPFAVGGNFFYLQFNFWLFFAFLVSFWFHFDFILDFFYLNLMCNKIIRVIWYGRSSSHPPRRLA